MRALWSSVLGVIAVAAIVVGVNLIADGRLAAARVDVTAQHLYTLSPGTRQVLAGLKEPVTLRLFYSPRLGSTVPVYGTYADRVRELLAEYAQASGGKVRLEFLDPEPFSDTEDRALGYGLQGVPVDQGGEQVYFGIAGTNLLDDERSIAFLQPQREQFLEYDLTRLVYELSNPARPVVGVLTTLPLDGDPRQMMMRNPRGAGPWASMLQLREAYTIKTIDPAARAIDPDVQVLLVAQPGALSDATLYAIDQFVMRGGRLMAMVDPASEAQAAMPGPDGQPPANTASDLHRLFDAWGIAYDPTKVVGDLTGAWRVRAGGTERAQAVDYVAWFNIRDGIARDDPATADLQQVTVASAGFIAPKPGAAITVTPLLTSSDQSAVLPVDAVRTPDPAGLLASFKPDGVRRTIAARVRGKLHSAFAGPPEGDPTAPYKAETDGTANLVVIADTDILSDRFWVRVQDFFGQTEATPFSDNGPFVANLVGTLAGGDALIGLRGRTAALRPFTLVDRMRERAEAQFRASEKALQQHLDETQKQLRTLREGAGDKSGGQAVITAEQRAAIDAATDDVLRTRRELRSVQLNLNRDISALRTRLELLDVAAVPALLALLAAILGIARMRRRARARA